MKKTEMVITLLDLAKANGWVGDYWDSIDEMRFKMGITSVIWPIIFSHNFAKAVYGLNTLNKELDPHDLSKMEEDFNGFYGVLRYAYQEGGTIPRIGPC